MLAPQSMLLVIQAITSDVCQVNVIVMMKKHLTMFSLLVCQISSARLVLLVVFHFCTCGHLTYTFSVYLHTYCNRRGVENCLQKPTEVFMDKNFRTFSM